MKLELRSDRFVYRVQNGNVIITGYNHVGETSVEIPAEIGGFSVKYIDAYAFDHCNVNEITVPEGVEEIYGFAFNSCAHLKKVNLPSTLRRICTNAFYECDCLEYLTIPEDCKIERDPVVGYSFRNFIFSGEEESRYSIDGVIFDRKNDALLMYPAERTDEEYIIPDFVRQISAGAFNNVNSLKRIYIPKTMNSIASHAFDGCTGVEEIVLHDQVEWIEDHAFFGCTSLKHIDIPDSVRGIEAGAFALSGIEKIRLPFGMTHIVNGVFQGCRELRNIEHTEHISSIGRCAFKDCCSLEEIRLSSCIAMLDNGAFENCASLRNVIMPDHTGKTVESGTSGDSLIAIQSGCFSGCTSLTSLIIPRNTRFVKGDAFDRCGSLSKLFIPVSVEEIMGNELGHRTNITDIFYEGSEAEWTRIRKSTRLTDRLSNVAVHYNRTFIE